MLAQTSLDISLILFRVFFGKSSSGKSILASICYKIFNRFFLNSLNLSADSPLIIFIACCLCISVSEEIKSAILSALSKFILPF